MSEQARRLWQLQLMSLVIDYGNERSDRDSSTASRQAAWDAIVQHLRELA